MNTPENQTEMVVRAELPQPAALARGAAAALEFVKAYAVTDDESARLAADELRDIKGKASKLEDQRKAITAPMDQAKKAIMDLFRSPIEVLGEAEAILKRKLLDYQAEQRRLADEARIAAERAAAEERARLQREAAELAAAGRAGEAAIKVQVAEIMVASAPTAVAPAKLAGVSTRTTLEVEVTDLAAFVAHVAANPQLVNMLQPNLTAIRQAAQALGDGFAPPGVRIARVASLAAARR